MSSTQPIDRLMRPLKLFAAHKLAGASLLLAATAAALVWANSPWSGAYFDLLRTQVVVGAGEFALQKPLLLWINDGLMGIFFFLVGLEIKREVLAGELSSRRKALLPVAAAIGGMVVPAALYLALNWGTRGARGWGVPMATDIAFALGVLALFRVPPGIKVFLTALAIVDDIGAVIVIALFYTDRVAVLSLVVGTVFLLVSIVANMAGVRNALVFFLLGLVVWLAFVKSGVHATLAAVLMAMTIPARTRIEGAAFLATIGRLLERLRGSGLPAGTKLLTHEQHHLLEEMGVAIDEATAPLQQLEHHLVPPVTFLVLPVFALANAGLVLEEGLAGSLLGPVGLGIVLGLVVGKQIGIFLFAWVAVKLGWADLPRGATWRHVHAVAVLGGIGFTMSLFISSLAFSSPELGRAAKIGILSASALSAVLGSVLLALAPRAPVPAGSEGTAVPSH